MNYYAETHVIGMEKVEIHFENLSERRKKMKKLKSLVPLLSLSTGWQTKIDFSVTFKFSSNLNGSNYGLIPRFRSKP